MSNLYGIGEHAFCPGCLAKGFRYRRDDANHFRLHVPRDRWPANMREDKPKRVVVNGLVLSPDDPRAQAVSEFDALLQSQPVAAVLDGMQPAAEQRDQIIPCDCGYLAKNDAAMTMHRRMAKVHKQAVTA